MSLMSTYETLRGVIFDLDGTLVDSAADIRYALNQFLATRNRRSVTLAETQWAIGDGAAKLVERIMAATGEISGDLSLDTKDFIEVYNTITADKSQIYPYVTEVLAQLQSQGIALGLCTNKPETATRKLLADLDLQRYFNAVAGGDTFPKRKPDSSHLRGVIDLLGVPASGCVMVGDSINDFLAAQGLGIPCVMVNYGYGADADLLPAAAVIAGMQHLYSTLMKIGFCMAMPAQP
jgi:phosphoglycolate phosphatase